MGKIIKEQIQSDLRRTIREFREKICSQNPIIAADINSMIESYLSEGKRPTESDLIKKICSHTTYLMHYPDKKSYCEQFLDEIKKYLKDKKMEDMDEECKQWCYGEKYKKGTYKSLDYKYALYAIEESERNFNLIHTKREISIKECIVSEFSIFTCKVFEYQADPNDIIVYVESGLEKFLHELVGAINTNIREIKSWGNIMEDMEKEIHFKVLLTNPSYQNNLDSKFISFLNENKIADIITSVNPTTWIFNLKDEDKTKYEEMWKYFSNCQSINMFFGNQMFDILLFVPIAISIYNTVESSDSTYIIDQAFSNKNYTVTDFNQITKFGKLSDNVKTVFNTMKKIAKEKYTSLKTKRKTYKNVDINLWYTIISTRRGTAPGNDQLKKDIYTLMNLKNNYVFGGNITKEMKEKSSSDRLYEFTTEQEARNFEQTYKTKIMSLFNAFAKYDGNETLEVLDQIPYLDDFSHAYTDADLIKKFEVTKEAWEVIDYFIPSCFPEYDKEIRGNITEDTFKFE